MTVGECTERQRCCRNADKQKEGKDVFSKS